MTAHVVGAQHSALSTLHPIGALNRSVRKPACLFSPLSIFPLSVAQTKESSQHPAPRLRPCCKEIHRAVVSYTPAVGWEAVAAALESGAYKGATPRMSHFTQQNPGLLSVYVDDMETPLLTVPLSMETILRTNRSTAWVGFTSGTGEAWQIVDLVAWNFTTF